MFLDRSLPVAGQGVVCLTLNTRAAFRIILTSRDGDTSGDVIVLDVTPDGAAFRSADDDEAKSLLKETKKPGDGLEPGVKVSYWLSLDSQNRRLRYGKGYAQAQLTLLDWNYPAGPPGETDPSKLPFGWTENLRYVALRYDPGATEPDVDYTLSPVPVVRDLPALVVSDEKISLDDLARGEVTVSANLSEACRILYANVAGADIRLDTPDFPDFSEAINYSILTPGCVCFELLKRKESEFGKPNPRGTYLRITLGENLGDSPGIPYVLEIWPGQNYSPIHNHAEADAVIKVLHGRIQSRWFAALSPEYIHYYEQFELTAGQVTWLSSDYYQTHQLFNPMPIGHMTATLQCYRYPATERTHDEYFHYLEETSPNTYVTKDFYPNSDMDFLEFKAKVYAEWSAFLGGAGVP